jgi:adenylyltransferase/sulfurtransferase
MDMLLSNQEIKRYSRHLIMPEVGLAGQKKLKQASVLCVGTGGLGSPLALYLAAAGVGRIGLVDCDVVDFSNLQRQVLHFTSDVGRSKLESASEKLRALNPEIEIVTHNEMLTADNAIDICRNYDVIADGTDNFATRYLTNDACVLLGKPNVHASIFRFEGQASVFYAKEGPCYRCVYPEPPPPGEIPSCAEGGVLGILPGLLGVVQATEAIKLILKIGTPLIGRMMLFDALEMGSRELHLRKDPNCAICGAAPTIRELTGHYDVACGTAADPDQVDISARTLFDQLQKRPGRPLLLDVREPHEWEICRIEGARLIPLNDLPARVHELDLNSDIVVYCLAGSRSRQAVSFLRQAGYRRTQNLAGGIRAWADQVDPEMSIY